MDMQTLLVLVTLVSALATSAIAIFAALQARVAAKAVAATRETSFAQNALSLWRELENPLARGDRRSVYRSVAGQDADKIAREDELRVPTERVASSFDYLASLAMVDDMLMDLAIEFYGVPAIRSWAVLKPYVEHMINTGKRAGNFHRSFRWFAETAATHEKLSKLPGIEAGRKVAVDLGDDRIEHINIWNDDSG